MSMIKINTYLLGASVWLVLLGWAVMPTWVEAKQTVIRTAEDQIIIPEFSIGDMTNIDDKGRIEIDLSSDPEQSVQFDTTHLVSISPSAGLDLGAGDSLTEVISPDPDKLVIPIVTAVLPPDACIQVTGLKVIKLNEEAVQAGNTTAMITGMRGEHKHKIATIIFDHQSPSVTAATISKPAISNGAEIISFTASEELLDNPIVRVGERAAQFSSREGNQFQYQFPVTTDDADGIFPITVLLTDLVGNTSNIEDVGKIIIDHTPPQLSLIGERQIDLENHAQYVEKGAQALDGVDGDISGKVQASGVVDTKNAGDYQLTYVVSDQAGNTATIVRMVKVLPSPAIAENSEQQVVLIQHVEAASSQGTPQTGLAPSHSLSKTSQLSRSGSSNKANESITPTSEKNASPSGVEIARATQPATDELLSDFDYHYPEAGWRSWLIVALSFVVASALTGGYVWWIIKEPIKSQRYARKPRK